MRKIENLIDKKFGLLTVESGPFRKDNLIYWNCICKCGNNKLVKSGNLKNNKTKSCGCLYKSRSKHNGNTYKHKKEYAIWNSMINRCYNKNNKDYKNYGGKGIKVCDRWKNNFSNFFNDMGLKPESMSLDRINNNGNYEPENCKWSTYIEQASNRSNNRKVPGVKKRKTKYGYTYTIEMNLKGKFLYLGSTKDFFEACCIRKSAEAKIIKLMKIIKQVKNELNSAKAQVAIKKSINKKVYN